MTRAECQPGVRVVGGRGEAWLLRGQDGVEVTVPHGVCPRCLGEALRTRAVEV